MKILLVSRYIPFPGGRENFVYELSQSLKNTDDISLLTPDGLIGDGVNILPYVSDKEHLRSILDKIKPDIVNSHTFYLCDPLIDICKDKGIPFIITLHGDQFVIGDNQRQEKIKDLVSRVSHVVTVCDAGKLSVLKNTSINEKNISVINNGVNNSLFKSDNLSQPPIRDLLRKNASFPSGKFIFIIPARMIWYKGLDFLIDTIVDNRSEYENLNLYFIISTPNTSTSKEEMEFLNNILTKIKTEKIENLIRVVFSGYEYMPYIYRMSNAFILPSVSEQFPISILEAMASSIPVIATNVGGVNEIISHNHNGMLISSGNKEELNTAIISIFKDQKFRNGLCKNALVDICNKFSINHASKNYQELYRSIII